MILAVLFANVEGNILIERFHGVPAEERLHWRSFLVKLGADNLKGAKNEELLVACHKSVYIVYTVLGDVSIYVVGKDEYDELALSEVIFVITSAVKDVCGKPPTERLFLDKYGRICLCLDEIVWKLEWEGAEVSVGYMSSATAMLSLRQSSRLLQKALFRNLISSYSFVRLVFMLENYGVERHDSPEEHWKVL
ncbi:hypothetical protein AHAS_Ahas18G0006200 [Arachis hypogaea]